MCFIQTNCQQCLETDKQRREAHRQTDRKADIQEDRDAKRQTSRQTDIQTYRQKDRQKDKQTNIIGSFLLYVTRQ